MVFFWKKTKERVMRKRKKLLFAVLTCLMIFACGAITVFAADGGKEYVPKMYSSFWALVPPIVAIGLALITKEVYSSLFVGIAIGGIFWSNFHFEKAVLHIFEDGIVGVLTDSYNMGILVFLVILGIMVCMMNNAGGSAAFGRWASIHIKTRVGAELATILLGVLIFIDDYFNCLTVGNVMRPVTDKQKISRAKLAYIIDATAAPICIIAPISSWAAAVTGYTNGDGFSLFLQTIPFNLYAWLTILMVIFIGVTGLDYGPMKKFEENAAKGDLFSGKNDYENVKENIISAKGKVIDLVLPVIFLIASCIICMIYTGGFFEGESFINAFANCDASMGLVMGSFITLVFVFLLYLPRRVITFSEFAECIPQGFKMMVSAILILVLAWTLGGFCSTKLEAGAFVSSMLSGNMTATSLFPAILFLVGSGLAFATGTSWGTFGILIPIVTAMFPETDPMLVVCIAASLAGSVCGDHMSPISDTTIMASAGAQCHHVDHVSTQLPYALTVGGCCVAAYLVAGFTKNVFLTMAAGVILLFAVLSFIRYRQAHKCDMMK
jgi:tetracycline resistance efflux pump